MNPNIRIIRYEECESSLWKNGSGSTKQLLIWPKGADLSNFDFRISIATISSDGPFSLFHGIDRQLCILEGEGVKLHIKGNDLGQSEEIILRPNDSPFCFSGETQIESKLLDKQILDFNVMTRRGKYHACIEQLKLDDLFSLEPTKTSREDNVHKLTNTQNNELQQWLLCLEPLNLVYKGQTIQLKPYDMLQYKHAKNSKKLTSELRFLRIKTSEAVQQKIKQTEVKDRYEENDSQIKVLLIFLKIKKSSC
ncbi:HutD family protein [Shewanella seohaensis]|uniref:HutD/Ves family protein n=1 Tax=Shewanella seohaensis TaxID=755175 RepID=UPI0021C68FF7|nr:HutD family protein [Shewanella seohaensis]UXM81347.1 HutD family protein [Shewanella seohaensis]